MDKSSLNDFFSRINQEKQIPETQLSLRNCLYLSTENQKLFYHFVGILHTCLAVLTEVAY